MGGSCKLHLPVGLVRKPVRVFIYSKVMCNFSLVPVLSCGGEERVPGTHCAYAPSSLGNLHLSSLFTYWKAALDGYIPVEAHRAVLKSKATPLWRWQSALLCSKRSMSFKERDCVSNVLQYLAGMLECMDNSNKRRAEYLRWFFVIVHTERGQW